MSRIVVTGSLNMDLIVQVRHLPAPGETVLGSSYAEVPGGKGANQACAAGRLSAQPGVVAMLGCVGSDAFGDHLEASLRGCGVETSALQRTTGPSGVALISVDRRGQNSIVVASGANIHYCAEDLYQGCSIALFQLETPVLEVAKALKFAKSAGATTILDPAPAQPLTRDLLQSVDILTPNETEAEAFAGPARSPIETAQRLLDLGPSRIILKLGQEGCLYTDGKDTIISPAFHVTPVDTIAAGDCFNGALAVALRENLPMLVALRFANAAAAISVTRAGAQASLPARAEVDEFLQQHPDGA